MSTVQQQQPVTAAPPAPPPSPFPRSLRTLIHATIITIFMHALALPLATRPLGQTILGIASPGYFLPWSIGVACGLNSDRIVALTGALVIVVCTFPDDLLAIAIPALAGLLAGTSIRAMISGAPV